MGRITIVGIAAALAISSAAHAQSISNGGFEGGPMAGGNQVVNVGQTSIPGWTVVNQAGLTTGGGKEVAWLGNGAFGYNTPFGTDYLDLTGYAGSTGNSGVSQTIATLIGATYTLNFYLGGKQGSGPVSVRVNAGAQSGLLSDALTGGTFAGDTVWSLQSFNFTATSLNTVLSIIGEGSGQDFIGLDNVSLSGGSAPSGVPEPATWAMMMIGFGAMGATMRRRSGVMTRVRYA